MKKPIISGLLASALLAFSNVAYGCDAAERLRLSDEIASLAAKNAWSGVERKYNELLKTKCDLKFEQYSLGAESAKNLGKTFEQYERLVAATAIDPQEALTASIEQIESNFGRVHVRGDARRRAALIREQMPFAPDQRKSIEYAQSVMEGRGSFKGMLPVGGPYKVADKEFTVETGSDEFLEVVVGKGKGGGGGGRERPDVSDQGFINWAGPVVMVGTGFYGTPAPKDPIYVEVDSTDDLYTDPSRECNGDSDAYIENGDLRGCVKTVRHADDINLVETPTLDVTFGGEVGLTYRSPEIGVVGTVTFRRMFGNRLNHVSVWGAAMMRPGNFRFAVGPTWGFVFGKGNGYAEWVSEGQSEAFRTNTQPQAEYNAWSTPGGVAGSAGFGFMDIGPFRGIIDIHGSLGSDGTRNHSSVGLRFGIVPKIERFEG